MISIDDLHDVLHRLFKALIIGP